MAVPATVRQGKQQDDLVDGRSAQKELIDLHAGEVVEGEVGASIAIAVSRIHDASMGIWGDEGRGHLLSTLLP